MSLTLALTLNAIAGIALVAGLTWLMGRPTKLTPHLTAREEHGTASWVAAEQPSEQPERIAA